MSDKAARKKQYILDTAKQVFASKGFKDVSMKDIVEACEISRGGLYLYFDSTESILTEIINEESSQNGFQFLEKEDDNVSYGNCLALFLKEQKLEILNKKNNLTVAIYEYLFSNSEETAKASFEKKVDLLSKLIEKGTESGEFVCDDAVESAKHVLFTLEGLKVTANTYGLSEEDMDNELVLIMSSLLADEE